MMEVQVDPHALVEWLRRASAELQSGARQALGQSVALALRHARLSRSFDDRTGALRRSIVRGQTGPWVQFIRAGDARVKYARFVEGGTKAHEITPKASNRSGLLRFRVAGQWVSARKVNHPGTIAANYMRDASREGAEALLDMMDRAVNRALL
jgi:hypothetical protein